MAKKTTKTAKKTTKAKKVAVSTSALDSILEKLVQMEERLEVIEGNKSSAVTPTNKNGRDKGRTVRPVRDNGTVTKTAATVNEIKARYELWAIDEYNSGSIVASNTRLDKVLENAKRYVTEVNVDNALAASEKDKAWEAYFPQVYVDGEETTDIIYAGNRKDGKHYVYVKGEDKWELRRPDPSVKFRFYLGQINNGRTKSDWYLTDHRGREITSLTDQLLDRKMVLFVKII